MKTTFISKAIISLVIGLAASISTGAMAERYSETIITTTAEGSSSVTVSHADLDLSNTRGQEALERRISRAAKLVCGSSNHREVGLRLASKNKTCYKKAVASANAQILEAGSQFAVVSR